MAKKAYYNSQYFGRVGNGLCRLFGRESRAYDDIVYGILSGSWDDLPALLHYKKLFN